MKKLILMLVITLAYHYIYAQSGNFSTTDYAGSAVTATHGNNSGSFSGGYAGKFISKSANGGGSQTGIGVYITSPYDGSSPSGNTYSYYKYGLFVDDLYSYFGNNTTYANTNYGLYIKGGGQNYIAGNLGIGTTNPSNKLTVGNGNVSNAGFAEALINTANANTNALMLSNWTGSGTNYGPRLLFDNSTHGIWYVGGSDGSNNFDITQTWGTPSFRISANGYVGIGTTGPDEKLTVKGKIHSSEVIVDLMTTVPDYVFEPDYKLTSLTELKRYVDQYHHLPNIPSAKEIEKEGIQLGDMNMKLLKKVEELTLYLIEKDKQVSTLQDDVIKLKTQIASIAKN